MHLISHVSHIVDSLVGLRRDPASGRPALQHFACGFGDLPLMPIDPSFIVAGTPIARGITLAQSPDGKLTSGLWECTEGKLRWRFYIDEIIHVLDGEASLRPEGSSAPIRLRPGDVAQIASGSIIHWDIPRFVRKLFVTRS